MIQQKATNVVWQDGEISRRERYGLLGQTGATIWFTGLSGSGKSTIAVALEHGGRWRGPRTRGSWRRPCSRSA